eukprot:gnl/Chilomastix_cuspidata/6782.p2 GENE.gnl/Chilomastix_cuspidata/6782~~gnl/Chilomastix_cuspidata/6782.p2  ORF type:complete len:117 (-),score=2.82 gnl/Chilomastix_cuspidata/6782:72-422(-)
MWWPAWPRQRLVRVQPDAGAEREAAGARAAYACAQCDATAAARSGPVASQTAMERPLTAHTDERCHSARQMRQRTVARAPALTADTGFDTCTPPELVPLFCCPRAVPRATSGHAQA